MIPQKSSHNSGSAKPMIYSNNRALDMHEYQLARLVAITLESDSEPKELSLYRRRFENNRAGAMSLAQLGLSPMIDSQDYEVLRLRGEFK